MISYGTDLHTWINFNTLTTPSKGSLQSLKFWRWSLPNVASPPFLLCTETGMECPRLPQAGEKLTCAWTVSATTARKRNAPQRRVVVTLFDFMVVVWWLSNKIK